MGVGNSNRYNPLVRGVSMSTTTKTKSARVSRIAEAIITMPNGKKVDIPLPPKVYKTGREGFYGQIQAFIYEDEDGEQFVMSGQIQIWKKTPKVE